MAINFLNLRASLDEKTLTPAEKKKREEVAKAIERENPNMPMGMKMAIATKTAKRVAEETKYYSLVHKATNKVLSTHKDLESAKDEHRGMDQGERAHYRIATSTKEPKTWNMKEELDELNQMTLARYQSKAKSVGMQGGPKSAKHLAGAKRAGEKLKYGDYSEEVEQVDELKQSTVKSYMNKSITDFGHQNFMSRVGKGADKETATRKAKNRSLGIERANKKLKEDVEQLDEMDSKDRFKDYHNETAKLMKGIHSALSQHYNLHNKTAHWGHVGDIRHIHDQLRDIHDRLHEQGEYAKNAKEHLNKMNVAMRGEEVELSEAGPFSYGIKPPKKGSVAYNAMMKRKEQEKDKQPIEPKDQMVGIARKLTKESAEQLEEWYSVHPHKDNGHPAPVGSPTKFHSSAISKTLEHTKAGRTVTVRYQDHKGEIDSVTIKPGQHVKKALDSLKTERTEEAVHYCAKHVYSELFGEGQVIEGDHAEPNEDGHVEWYNVQFEHGIEKVFTEDIEIMMAEYHANHKRKKRMTNGR